LKREKLVEVQKTEVEKKKKGGEKKEKLLREATVKIGLKQEKKKEEIVVEALLDSGMMGLVMSLEFVRKNKFKMRKLEKPIYIRNVNSIFNYEEPIEYICQAQFTPGVKVHKIDLEMCRLVE